MRAITVLGMHRSGTSALTRAIDRLGAYPGPEDHLGRHWENRYLRRTNQRLLDQAGGTWDSPPSMDELWSSGELLPTLKRARETVGQEFDSHPVAIWKDPRTCLTLPFWQRVFDEDPVLLFIYRHPIEVSGSLAARNGLVSGHALALWERYNHDALRFSAGLPTLLVEYGSLLEDPVEKVVHMVEQFRALGVDLPNDPRTTDLGLVAAERHQEVSSDDLDHPLLTDSQRALYYLLTGLQGVHQALKLPRTLPRPHPLSIELLALASARVRGPDVEPRGVTREPKRRKEG